MGLQGRPHPALGDPEVGDLDPDGGKGCNQDVLLSLVERVT